MADAAATRSTTDTTSPGTIRSASVTDRATKDDLLGFKPYVEAIATFLQAPETEAPITLSIEGEWGSGKSSFLLMLEDQLRAKPNPAIVIPFNAWRYDKQDELWAAFALHVTRGLRNGVIWPKRYWGDVRLFFSRIKGAVGWLNFAGFALLWLLLLTTALSLNWWSWHASVAERAALVDTLLPPAAAKAATASVAAAAAKPNASFYNFLLHRGPLLGSVGLLLAFIGRLGKSIRTRLLDFRLERFIDQPDYKGHASFVEAFHEDFSKTLDAYLGGSTEKVYVMVDDLDRCDVPKAAELMQAINLMIGETRHLIFLLGMDRDKVAAGIAYKYKEVLPYLPGIVADAQNPTTEERLAFGYAFLEKFIQLSFRVPAATDDARLRNFLENLSPVRIEPPPTFFGRVKELFKSPAAEQGANPAAGSTPAENADPADPRDQGPDADPISQPQSFIEYCRIHTGDESANVRDVVLMVKDVFGSNPRRLKLFLNTFRLSVYLASRQGLFDRKASAEGPITLEQLGKFLALGIRCPKLLGVLASDGEGAFFQKLEAQLCNPFGDSAIKDNPAFTLEPWLNKPGVRSLLQYGMLSEQVHFEPMRYRLRDFPARKFLCIVPLAEEPVSLAMMIQEFETGSISSAGTNAALARIAEKAYAERRVAELVEKRSSTKPSDMLVALAVATGACAKGDLTQADAWLSMAMVRLQAPVVELADFIQYHALRLIQELVGAGTLSAEDRRDVRLAIEANLDSFLTNGSRGKNRLRLANQIIERLATLDAVETPLSTKTEPRPKRTKARPAEIDADGPMREVQPESTPVAVGSSAYSSSSAPDFPPRG